MRRNRLYFLAVLIAVAAVAGPALGRTVQSHAAKAKATRKVGPRGPRGPRGRRGRRGAAGPTGPAGANGGTASSFLRTVVVSPSGTTAIANGAVLAAAVAATGGAGVGDTYLVWIEPGVYDLSTTQLTIPSYVDVQGSGQDATTIEGEGPVALAAASSTEIRALTVTDTNATGSAEAIATSGGLRDVTATASGTSAATAVLADAATMPIVDVTASATAALSNGLVNAIHTRNTASIEGGSFTATALAGQAQAAALFAESLTTVSNASLQATGGSTPYAVDVVGSNATVTIKGSTLVGAGGFFVAPGDTLDVGGSQIPGIVAAVSGKANCPDDWLADYSTASTDCS